MNFFNIFFIKNLDIMIKRPSPAQNEKWKKRKELKDILQVRFGIGSTLKLIIHCGLCYCFTVLLIRLFNRTLSQILSFVWSFYKWKFTYALLSCYLKWNVYHKFWLMSKDKFITLTPVSVTTTSMVVSTRAVFVKLWK